MHRQSQPQVSAGACGISARRAGLVKWDWILPLVLVLLSLDISAPQGNDLTQGFPDETRFSEVSPVAAYRPDARSPHPSWEGTTTKSRQCIAASTRRPWPRVLTSALGWPAGVWAAVSHGGDHFEFLDPNPVLKPEAQSRASDTRNVSGISSPPSRVDSSTALVPLSQMLLDTWRQVYILALQRNWSPTAARQAAAKLQTRSSPCS